MHSVKMRFVATHVAWSVCLFVTAVSPTKTDERIQMPLECKLTGAGGKGTICEGTHWLHLANTNVFHFFHSVCPSFCLVTAPAYIVSE